MSNKGLQENPRSRIPSKKYDEGWERIFGKDKRKKKQPKSDTIQPSSNEASHEKT